MKIGIETVGSSPPDESKDESPADPMTRWHRLGELLKVWGTAVEVWVKILVMVLVGAATLLKSVLPH